MTSTSRSYFEWQAANPLLAGIPQEMTDEEMEVFLAHDPAKSWEGEIMPKGKRRGLAHRVKDLFVAVPRCVQAAQLIHEGLLNGLAARDARLPQNRAAIYEQAAMTRRVREDKMSISALPWFSGGAPGFVFSGPTGEGKSMLIERYLAGLPQVLVRAEDAECGWKQLKQLVWLKVGMPANGGRLGLLTEITLEIDRLLGTDYHRELRARGVTIDVQLVMVLGWLSLHRCGLLVIEESQERTAHKETFGAEFLTYFLKILNWGIPMLVIGNPKALAIIESFSQDERRFAEAWVDFLPISDPEDPEWKDYLVPAIWSWTVMPNPDQPIENVYEFLWGRTGGHRAALSLLRREAHFAALACNSDEISKQHIIMGFNGISFKKRQKYIAGLITKDIGVLETYTDFPVGRIAKHWDDERKAMEKLQRRAAEQQARGDANDTAGPPPSSAVSEPSPAQRNRAARKPKPASNASSGSGQQSPSDLGTATNGAGSAAPSPERDSTADSEKVHAAGEPTGQAEKAGRVASIEEPLEQGSSPSSHSSPDDTTHTHTVPSKGRRSQHKALF